MDYLSHRVDRNEIKPGDHIYTWRTAFTYAHHGIYVRENKVIHFTSDRENASGSVLNNLSSSLIVPSSCFSSIDSGFSQPECGHNCDPGSCLCTYAFGFHQPDSGVTLSCLNCFIQTGSLYRYQYGVKAWTHLSKLRGGTCTMEPSNPPEYVINRAIYLFKSETGFGRYNVVRNNCEDFALYCKTGLLVQSGPATGASGPATGASGQVNSVINVSWSSVVSLPWSSVVSLFKKGRFNATTDPLSVAVAVGRYYLDRYKSDIGVRDDVIEVKVEDVGSYRPNF